MAFSRDRLVLVYLLFDNGCLLQLRQLAIFDSEGRRGRDQAFFAA